MNVRPETDAHIFAPPSRLAAKLVVVAVIAAVVYALIADVSDGLRLRAALGMATFAALIIGAVATPLVMWLGREIRLDPRGVTVTGITGDARHYPWAAIDGVYFKINGWEERTMRISKGMQLIYLNADREGFWPAARHVEQALTAHNVPQHWPMLGGRDRWWRDDPAGERGAS